MDSGGAAHAEPTGEKGRQHAEVTAVGGLAQQDAYHAQQGVTGYAEQCSEDAERAHEVVGRLATDLVGQAGEADTATGVGKCGTRQDHGDRGDAERQEDGLFLGDDGEPAADVYHEHEPDGPPFLPLEHEGIAEVWVAVLLLHVWVLAQQGSRRGHDGGVDAAHDEEHGV